MKSLIANKWANIRRCLSLTLVLLVSATLGFVPATQIRATTLNGTTLQVTKFTDSFDGACDSDCSLREAIEVANHTSGPDTITLQSGIYQLSIPSSYAENGDTIEDDENGIGDLDIFGDLTLSGVYRSSTIIDGGRMGRVIKVHPATVVTVNDLTIRNGLTSSGGGGISNGGDLTLTSVSVTKNSLFSAGGFTLGGGIENSGTLTLQGGEISFNIARAAEGSYGGGIYNAAGSSLQFNMGTILANTAENDGTTASFGGGIYNAGTLSLTLVTVTANAAVGDHCHGGGILNEGQLAIDQSTINSNSASRSGEFGDGGGLYSSGVGSNVTLDNSAVYGNVSSNGGSGGGLWNSDGSTMRLRNSTITSNTSTDNGGGINNTHNAQSLTILNSTIADNRASGSGGGLWNDEASTASYHNTLLAGNQAGSGADCQNSATLTSAGHNLVGNGTGCDSSGPGDLTVDPNVVFTSVIKYLARNLPGITETHALWSASPALDAGDDTVCPATDQRGVTRPQGAHCDIGAYEATAPPPSPTSLFLPVIRR